MVDHMIEERLENLDRRLARIEQILPTLVIGDELKTLATKAELHAAIAPLATKEELRAAIAPLATKDDLKAFATKDELRLAVQEEGERSRRYMDVLTESLRGDIHMLAAHAASERPKDSGA